MTKVVALYAMKGGVGKSSLAVNLAHCAAGEGRRTLLWDLDAQGGATFLLGCEAGGKAKRLFSGGGDPAAAVRGTAVPGLDLIAADLSLRQLDHALAEADKPKRLRKLLAEVAPAYDVIVLDCPPGLGELSDQIFRAADMIVLPMVPAPLAMRTFNQVREHLAVHHPTRAPALLPVFSMVDRRKLLHREIVAAHAGWPAIPQASAIERMAVMQAPLATFAARSAAAETIGAIWRTVSRDIS